MLTVKEVGWLIKKQYIGTLQQKLRKHYFGALSSTQFFYRRIESESGNAKPRRNFFNFALDRVKVV
jgi:hypothetical protein